MQISEEVDTINELSGVWPHFFLYLQYFIFLLYTEKTVTASTLAKTLQQVLCG